MASLPPCNTQGAVQESKVNCQAASYFSLREPVRRDYGPQCPVCGYEVSRVMLGMEMGRASPWNRCDRLGVMVDRVGIGIFVDVQSLT